MTVAVVGMTGFAVFLPLACSGGEGSADGGVSDGGVSFEYDNPVLKSSPWPLFRRNTHNNGRSPIKAQAKGLAPWTFKTLKGIFHSPVIGGDGTVYIGSADTNFYAISRDGTEKWRFKTGEIIDSSALLNEDGTIFAPSGDGYLYHLTAEGKEIWKLQSPGSAGFITWWEGHITMDRKGVLYAGNDDYHLYAISRDGKILWGAKAGEQVWSCASFGNNGEVFFGSNDLYFRTVNSAGVEKGSYMTLGPVTSSPAVSDDGKLVVTGSFDGYVYGFKPSASEPTWKYPARDHIYGSAAVASDGTFYIGSADGTLYALNPDGTKKWQYDTLDPIRSSVAVDGDGTIYFGGADGKVYALNPEGSRKWSYDTSESDRNDLNGSPAVSFDGVVIGGESGKIFFLPFDYCTRGGDAARCSVNPHEDIVDNGVLLFHYTPGGNSEEKFSSSPVPTGVLNFRLVVRKDGDTVAARFNPGTLAVSAEPAFAFRKEISANGQFVDVIPDTPLAPGQKYTVTLSGEYLTGGTRVGNKVTGGDVSGTISGKFEFTVASSTGTDLPVQKTDKAVTVLRMKRLAVPQPPMMTTFNQIGFDSYNYLIAVMELDKSGKKVVMLAAEGTPGLEPVINKDTKSIFTLDGSYLDSFFKFSSDGFKVDVSGVGITLDLFRIGGLLKPDLTADGLDVYAEVKCSNVQSFGTVLDMLGLCNPQSGKMILNGTMQMEPQPGNEGKKPDGVTVASVKAYKTGGKNGGGYIEAAFTGSPGKSADHLPVIVLFDSAKWASVSLNYGGDTEKLADGSGNLTGVKLHLPKSMDPTGLTAVVTYDLFPMYEEVLPAK
jgi:outer membrane protein assembly factor BamB